MPPKMYKNSPIFFDGLECQISMIMTFIDYRQHLTCMLGPFFARQATWAAIGGRDVTHFLLTGLFYTIPSKNSIKYIEKLLVTNKSRIMVW